MVRLSAFKTPGQKAALVLATGFGFGLAPKAPGTFGSLGAGILIWAFWKAQVSCAAQTAFWVAIFLAGCWAALVFDRTLGTKDNSHVVIDEYLGMAIATIGIEQDFTHLVIAFALFRFFDILKLPPVRQLDYWSKKLADRQSPLSGFGIIADDLVAGLQSWVVLFLLNTLLR